LRNVRHFRKIAQKDKVLILFPLSCIEKSSFWAISFFKKEKLKDSTDDIERIFVMHE